MQMNKQQNEEKKLKAASIEVFQCEAKKATGFIFMIIIISALAGGIFGYLGATLKDINLRCVSLGSILSNPFLIGKKCLEQEDNTKSKTLVGEPVKLNDVQEESAVIDVVEKVSPSVVSIVISRDVPKIDINPFDPFDLNPFFGWPQDFKKDDKENQQNEKRQIGGGSGFIVSSDGMIITNKHVVSNEGDDYTVITSEGKKYEAKILALDPINDLAVLKIDANGLPEVKFADSDNLKIGQSVVAIGYSLGEFQNSVSKGIISGLKRQVTAGSRYGEVERLGEVIQTDAAINPGNSGGPLINLRGEVVGVNVAMAQGAENIGFALPSNLAKKAIESVKQKGKIVQPFLGVRYLIINKEIQRKNNLPYDYGALVIRGDKVSDLAVIPGSPADKAGIVENDIILEVNGKKVDEDNLLGDIIAKFNVGDTINVKVWHRGEEKTMPVTLEERK